MQTIQYQRQPVPPCFARKLGPGCAPLDAVDLGPNPEMGEMEMEGKSLALDLAVEEEVWGAEVSQTVQGRRYEGAVYPILLHPHR